MTATATTTEPAINLTIADFDASIHNGEITMTSPRTGDHRTFKIATVRKEESSLCGQRILYLLTGPNNESPGDWQGFAFIGDDGRCKVWKRFRGNGKRSSWEVFADMLDDPAYWAGRGVTYQVSGRCRRCNRLLTHPESIATGMGPECSGRGYSPHRKAEPTPAAGEYGRYGPPVTRRYVDEDGEPRTVRV
jgi:hypothetical protein